jgi:hypothetical protein
MEVLDFIREAPCCLLCFEADAGRCHRTAAASALRKLSGGKLAVVHVGGLENGRDEIRTGAAEKGFSPNE